MGSPRNRFDNIPLVAMAPREGREVIYATHNLCDPTSWYVESERVTDATLTEAGGAWSSGDTNWIDMIHGKVFDERALIADQMAESPGDPHGYAVVVKVDGVEKTQRAPFATSGGDYTVDYALGKVTPIGGSWTGSTVTASYSKRSGAGWILKPTPSSGDGDPGRALIIEKAEIQFSDDIAMTSGVRMEVFGLVDFFAPQLLTTNGGPLPPGTPIPIEETVYDSVDQMVDESVGMYPSIPALSASTGRGYTRPKYIFEFHYATARPLFSSLGMFMRISVDEPFGGERATATFYAVSARDVGAEKAIEILTTVQ
jgi:hypothetical protein